MSAVTVTIPQGSDLTIEITDLGDLTGATGYLSVRNNAGTVVFAKSTADADEGAIADPETAGDMEFYILPEDTTSLTVGASQYHYDAWIVTALGKRYQVREVSPFVVLDRVVVLP
jgi:hypothetical protein